MKLEKDVSETRRNLIIEQYDKNANKSNKKFNK